MAQLGFRTIEEMIGRVDQARGAQGGRALEGEGPRFQQPAVSARCRQRGRPLLPDPAGPRPREVARRHAAARDLQARDRARREGRQPSCRSATSTASSARSPAARSRASTARPACPRTRSRSQLQGLGGPELRRVRAARHDAATSKAMRTTTSARDCRAASSSSIRRQDSTFEP